MVQGSFPGSALVTQLFRQFTKPLSQRIVTYAARRPTFRRYFLLLPGRFYHRLEENLRRLKESPRLVRPDEKKPAAPALGDEQAVEIGSQLMIEVVIFGLLVVLLMCDSVRSQYKSAAKEDAQQEEYERLEGRKAEASRRLEALERESERLRTELARLEGQSPG